MSDKKMQTKPYGIEDRKVKIQKIMTQKEKKEYDKKYGIGLYVEPKKLKGGGKGVNVKQEVTTTSKPDIGGANKEFIRTSEQDEAVRTLGSG